MDQYIFIIRHGESLKNIKDRHGGRGESLTVKGKNEIAQFAKIILDNDYKPIQIYHSDRKQIIETVKILQNILSASIFEDKRLIPLHLGVLDGLSTAEAKQLHPHVQCLMEKWRKGAIEIKELLIPEIEDINSFWNRGKSFTNTMEKSNGCNIIVGTRSIITLLISILLKRSIEKGGEYKYIEVPNGAHICFKFDNDINTYILDKSLSSIKL